MFCVAAANPMGPSASVVVATSSSAGLAPPPIQTTAQVESEEVDIQIRNVVCNYSLPLHIDLRKVALNSGNVTFDRSRGVLYKQKRNPSCYVKIYSSGNVYIVGCRSEEECRRAARSVGRMVQRSMSLLDQVVRLRDYRICNVLATCKLPFGVKIEEMAGKYKEAHYEPELSVGLVWKFTEPKASLRIHTTGSITVTGATSARAVMQVMEKIYPIVQEFRCPLRLRGEATSRKRPAAPSLQKPAPPSAVSQLPREFIVAKRTRTVRAPLATDEDDPHCAGAFEAITFDDEEAFYEEYS